VSAALVRNGFVKWKCALFETIIFVFLMFASRHITWRVRTRCRLGFPVAGER
jgi:hypothetical protein